MRKRRVVARRGISRRRRTSVVSERLSQGVLDATPDCVFIKDKNLRYVFVNRAVCEFFGKSREEIVGRTARSLYPREAVEEIHRTDREVLKKASSIDRPVISVADRNGVAHTLRTRKGPLKDARGRVTHIIAIVRDITGQRQAEEELMKSEEKYRSLFENSRDAITINTPDGRFVDCNDAWLELFGHSRDEVSRLNVRDVYADPVDRDTFRREVEKKGFVKDYELRLRGKDGAEIHCLLTSAPWRAKDGSIIAYQGILRDITSRKQAEDALQQSEEKYRTLMEDAPISICNVDLEGTVTFVNKRFEEVSGYSREEVVGKNGFTLGMFDDETLEILAKRMKSILGGEPPRGLVTRFRCKEGKWIWVEMESRMTADKGVPVGIQIIARDVTERKWGEEKLMALHKHARTLAIASSTEEIVKHTLDAVEFTLGFDIADFCTVEDGYIIVKGSRGAPASPLKWPLDGPGIVAKTANIGRTLLVPDVREDPAFVDARKVTMREEAPPTLSELAVPALIDGKVAAVLNVESSRLDAFSDVDQRLLETLGMHVASALARLKQVETLERLVEDRTRRLQESEEKYRSLIKNIPVVTWTTDQRGNTVFISPNVQRVYGYTPQEICEAGDRLWFGRIHPDDLDHVRRSYERFFEEGQRYDVEYRIQRKDGEWIWLHDRAIATYEKDGTLYADGVFSDITQRKRMEQRLRQSERLAAIGELAAMVGHDLRNPLTGIAGAAYILRTIPDLRKHGEAEEFLDLIDRNVEYSDKIIGDLLDYSGEVQLELNVTDVKSMVTDALSRVNIPDNIRIADLTNIRRQMATDADKMRRVLVNLIKNAVEAMPEGGTLTISSRESNGSIEIAFADTGTGIAKEHTERIWNPFFTTKAKGMGFGLPISKRIVEAHGGSISVESTIGKGTTFTVSLPVEPRLREVKRRERTSQNTRHR